MKTNQSEIRVRRIDTLSRLKYSGALTTGLLFLVICPSPYPASNVVIALTSVVTILVGFHAVPIVTVSTRASIYIASYILFTLASVAWSKSPVSTLVGAVELSLVAGAAISVTRMHTGSELLTVMRAALRLLLLVSLVVALAFPSIGVVSAAYEAGTVRGIFNHRNLFAFVAALMGVTTLVAGRRSGKVLLLFDVLLVIICLAVSQSQTSIIAVAITSFTCWCAALARKAHNFSRTLMLVGMVLSGAICVYLVLASASSAAEQVGRDETLTGRTVIWEAVLNVSKRSPIVGVGWDAGWIPGSPTTNSVWSSTGFAIYEAHNGYLDVYFQLGIVGLGALVGLLMVPMLLQGSRLALLGSEGSAWPLAMVVFLIVSNLTESRFQIPLGWLVTCIGLLCAKSGNFNIDRR